MERSCAAAASLGSAVARAAARRCHRLLPPPLPAHVMPQRADAQRASARLGRLLSSLAPRAAASSGPSESVAAQPAAAATPQQVAGAPPPPLASGYRMPPKEIADIVDAPPEPLLSFSPDRKTVLQVGAAGGGWPLPHSAG